MTVQAFIDALTSRVGVKTVEVYPVDYPSSLDFARAAAGVADTSNKILNVAATCPHTKIVLGGYSQGAAVAVYTTTDTVPPATPWPTASPAPCLPTSPTTSLR